MALPISLTGQGQGQGHLEFKVSLFHTVSLCQPELHSETLSQTYKATIGSDRLHKVVSIPRDDWQGGLNKQKACLVT